MKNIPYTVHLDAWVNPHSHIREGSQIVPCVNNAIAAGIDAMLAMPNTQKGLCTAHDTIKYNQKLKAAVPPGHTMNFIPCFLLNEETTLEEIERCQDAGIKDCKVYPLNKTTKSQNGVKNYAKLLPKVQHCAKCNIKTHWHPEHPLMSIANHDAELVFLAITDMFLNETDAIIVWEHGSVARCIPSWKYMAKSGRFFVTLTAHHLAENSDGCHGDVRSTCKPPIGTEVDRYALVNLVKEDHSWVMAGLDDAPHPMAAKHVSLGSCACGAYTTPFGLLLYAHALHDLLATKRGIETFTRFTSRNARQLHNLPASSYRMKIFEKPFKIPPTYQLGDWVVEPFWAGRELKWSFSE